MKKLFLGSLLLLLFVIGGAALLLPRLVTEEKIKQHVQQWVQEKTGLTLRVDGKAGLEVFPAIHVTIDDIALHHGTEELLALETLDAGVQLWPLLSKRLEVTHVTLEKPVIHYRIDGKGVANWQRIRPPAPSSTDTKQTSEKRKKDTKPGITEALMALTLGDVTIRNGTVHFEDTRNKMKETLRDVNLALQANLLAGSADINGSVKLWQQRLLTFAFGTQDVHAWRKKEDAPLHLKLNLDGLATLEFDGKARQTAASAEATGKLETEIPDIAAFLAWQGTAAPPIVSQLHSLSVRGKTTISPASFAVREADIRIGDIQARGDVSTHRNGNVPYIAADMAFPELDVTPFLTPAEDTAHPPSSFPGNIALVASAHAAIAAPLAPVATPGWPTAPIDLSVLRNLNADLTLNTPKFTLNDLNAEDVSIALHLKDGALRHDINTGGLYGGSGNLKGVLSARGNTPRIDTEFILKDAALGALLKASKASRWVSGNITASGTLHSTGRSVQALMRELNGGGKISMPEGTVSGLDIDALINDPKTALLSLAGGDKQTGFSQLNGTYQITRGILRSNDLELHTRRAGLRGEGEVDLAGRTLDYRLIPTKRKTITGADGAAEIVTRDRLVPLRIHGPWKEPRITPDVQKKLESTIRKVIENPDALKDIHKGMKTDLKDIKKDFKEQRKDVKEDIRNLKEGLKGLFGK